MSPTRMLPVLMCSLTLASCSSIGAKATSDLFEAIERGDISAVNQALASKANINEVRFFPLKGLPKPCLAGRSGSNQSPLGSAAIIGNEAIAALLIERGADVNVPPYCTPLALAVIVNKPDMVRLLLSRNGSPILESNLRRPLIPGLFPPPSTDPAHRFSVLMLAASLNRIDMISLLAEHKVGIDLVDEWGRTALFYAAERGYSNSIRTLVKYGASINHRLPGSGQTALALAVVNQLTEAVRTLLELGADPNLSYAKLGPTGTRTITPLGIARERGSEIVGLLEQAGARE